MGETSAATSALVAESLEAGPRKWLEREAVWLDLGLQDYGRAYQVQLELHASRLEERIPDTMVVVEHTPCITLGRSAKAEHVLVSAEGLERAGIGVYRTDRGGDVTYHGPGQLVLYAIVDLGRRGKDVHAHVWRLEEVMIETLASLGAESWRRAGYPGVWTHQGKIGAVGVRVRRWVTFHGFSLNIFPNLAHFDYIVPCGLHGDKVTSLAQILGRKVEMELVKSQTRRSIANVFGARVLDGRRAGL